MAPFAREILAWLAETGAPIPLILDQTKASDRHQILMLSVRWGERALPLAWRVAETEGAIGFATQQELLEVVAGWLSVGQAVVLLADRFYGTPEMMCWCCDRDGTIGCGLRATLSGQAALYYLRGCPQGADLSQFPTTPGPRGRAQAVRDRRQFAGPPGAPRHRLGARPCRPDRTLLPAVLCPRAQSGRIPQQRSQAGDGAPSHATGQGCAQVRPDLLHAQPATLSRQSACLLPGPFRPLCRVKSQCYIFAARISKLAATATGVLLEGLTRLVAPSGRSTPLSISSAPPRAGLVSWLVPPPHGRAVG